MECASAKASIVTWVSLRRFRSTGSSWVGDIVKAVMNRLKAD